MQVEQFGVLDVLDGDGEHALELLHRRGVVRYKQNLKSNFGIHFFTLLHRTG